MEDLFSANISIDDENMVYRVIFEDDKYTFISEADNSKFPSFSFRRMNDRWVDQDLLPPDLVNQATTALDNYLLQQH